MSVLPVVARELLVQARRKSTYWIRVAASAIAGFLMLWLLVVGGAPVPTMSQGKTLFTILSILAFIYCLFIGAFVTADCLSAEKREGTLGLLFLTDLKGYDVVFGKLVSSSLHAVYGLLAVVPMMSITLLFGGVTAGEIARTGLVLGNTLFLSLSAGVLVSTLSQNERKAVFAAVLLILSVAAGPYELGYYMASNYARGTAFNVVESVLSPSPIFAFTLAQSSTVGAPPTTALYSSIAQTHAIAWVLLALSCAIVPFVCKDRPKGRRRERWGEWWRRRSLGSPDARAAFRRRALERNPCFWLSSRTRSKTASVWVLIVPLTAIGVWIYFKYRVAFYETSLFLLFTIHVLLKVWFAGETCSRWMEDRRGGALELLLSAPLQTREIIAGQELALRRQFGGPVAVTLGLTLLSWLGIVLIYGGGSSTEAGRTWLMISLPVLLADLAALRWVGMWRGLTARGLNRAIAGTLGLVLCLRWLLYLLMMGVAFASWWIGLSRWRSLSDPLVWLILAVALDCFLGWSARRKFLAGFRTVAANPSDYSNTHATIAAAVVATVEPSGLPAGSQIGPARSKLWWSNRRIKWASVAGATLLLTLGIPSVYRHSLRNKVEHRLSALRQAGLPLTIEELDQWRPAMTNQANAAEWIERSSPGLVVLLRIPGRIQQNLPGYRTGFPNRLEPLPAVMKDAIVSALLSNQTALAIIQSAPPLRSGRYAMDWKLPGGKYATQSQAFWTISQLLQFQVVLHAEDGDVEGALDSLRRLIELGRSLDREPGLMFQQMRTACFAKFFVVMQWLLNRHLLPDTELKTLQNEMIEAEKESDLAGALTGLRCLAVEWYRFPQTQSASAFPRTPGALEQLRMQIQSRVRDLTGASARDFINYLEALDEFNRIVQTPWPERFQKARRLGAEKPGVNPDGNPDRPFDSKRVFDSLISPNAEFAARCRTAMVSLAIERFRLRHAGRLPETLEELVPEFMAAVPCDPIDGRPIRYKPLSKGYRVHSIGKNEQDDVAVAQAAPPPQKGRPRLISDDITFSVER
jgi:ABC-type transport system involved in multi-copper enzyme maturation permease subunit